MDFLVQELNREVNTTGSKSQHLEITKLVVDMKSEIEKIQGTDSKYRMRKEVCSMKKGTLFVISGPSGCGKGTVLKRGAEKSWTCIFLFRQPRVIPAPAKWTVSTIAL